MGVVTETLAVGGQIDVAADALRAEAPVQADATLSKSGLIAGRTASAHGRSFSAI